MPPAITRRALRACTALALAGAVVVAASTVFTRPAQADAPAAWYVSFHGSSGSSAASSSDINNLYAYSADGSQLSKTVLPASPPLNEVRTMITAPDGSLYVANATKNNSEVLHYADAASMSFPLTPATPSAVFASGEGLQHPYGLAFTPAGTVLVSSQGSGSDPTPQAGVIQFDAGGPTATASAWATVTPPVPTGTIVPSASVVPTDKGGVSGPRAIVVVPAAGAGAHATLYVADDLGSAVRSYDAVTGAWLGDVATASTPGMGEPVGLVVHDGHLYVSCEKSDDVISIDLSTKKVDRVVPPKVDKVKLDHPAGLAFGADGRLYVNSRVGQQVLVYTLDKNQTSATSGSVFIDKLRDQPEVLMPVGAGSGAQVGAEPGATRSSAAASPSASAHWSGGLTALSVGGIVGGVLVVAAAMLAIMARSRASRHR